MSAQSETIEQIITRPQVIDLGIGQDGVRRIVLKDNGRTQILSSESLGDSTNAPTGTEEIPPNLTRWTYTVQEVAERCGRKDPTIRNWIKGGKLRSVKKTGRHMILVDSLNEFFTNN